MTHSVTVFNCLLSEGMDWRDGPLTNSKKNAIAVSIKEYNIKICNGLQMCGNVPQTYFSYVNGDFFFKK